MLFLVIEHFKNQDAESVYKRFQEQGRLMPEGSRYIDSWVEANFKRCFQLMECDDPLLFQQWIINWRDLVEFEIVPIVHSSKTKEAVNRV